MYCIGDLITEYEKNINNNQEVKKEQKLYKTKDAVKRYPFLTVYSLEKAVREKKIEVTKIGNTNYYSSTDLENFIESQKIKVDK
jgi:hypothetical protein